MQVNKLSKGHIAGCEYNRTKTIVSVSKAASPLLFSARRDAPSNVRWVRDKKEMSDGARLFGFVDARAHDGSVSKDSLYARMRRMWAADNRY